MSQRSINNAIIIAILFRFHFAVSFFVRWEIRMFAKAAVICVNVAVLSAEDIVGTRGGEPTDGIALPIHQRNISLFNVYFQKWDSFD